MKQTIVLLLAIFILSCGSKNETPMVVPGEAKIVAVWVNPDSSKRLDIMLRVIVETIKYDSSKKKKTISVDTIWGKPMYFNAVDSLGKTVIDSATGRPKQVLRYIKVPKDSVNWRIEGVPVDSLLK